MSNPLFSLEAVRIKEELPDELSFPSQLMNNDEVTSFSSAHPRQPTVITPSEKPNISVRTSIFEQKKHIADPGQRTFKRSQSSHQRESQLINSNDITSFSSHPRQPTVITSSEKPKISIRTSIFEQQKHTDDPGQRTYKRSQREPDKHPRYNRDRENNQNMNYSKKPRYESSSVNNNEYIRRDNNQYPGPSRMVAPPIRTNDPRINRRDDNGSYESPTQAVPLPLITQYKYQSNMNAVLYRCTKALEIIRKLKHSEALPMILYKFSDLKPPQPTSESAKKSPLILNSKNVEYLLQASEDSRNECQIALLSRQFKNISFQLQSTMRVLGADIDRISSGVASAEQKRNKEQNSNASLGIVYLSDKKFRICGTQTDYENFEDKAPPKTFANKEVSCNMVVASADKSVQTVVNTDGFSFSIESLLLLTPAQRKGLQEFKKLMNMSDDGKIASIRERQQHRRVNALMYGQEEEFDQYMNPPPAPKLGVSRYAMSFGPPL